MIGGEERHVRVPVEFKWPVEIDGVQVPHEVFGLGFIPELVDVIPEQVRYYLFPRLLENITYYNHTVRVGGVVRDLVIYYGEKPVENYYGFRCTDLTLYKRLVELLKGTIEHMIPLSRGELIVNGVVRPTVPMIGEVLVRGKEVTTRWVYGYGFGLGLGGWGYGGLGYGYGLGYPYGYWGR